jgi:hypothetical protein
VGGVRGAARSAPRAAAAVLIALAGCSGAGGTFGADNFRDLEGVPSMDPTRVAIVNNVDGHPNLVAICIQGVAFVTSSRDYGDAVNRVPELDSRFCTNASTPTWAPPSR